MENDKKILDLKRKIDGKEKILSNSLKFSPVTNCSLQLSGKHYNLHSLGKSDLTSLLVELNMYRLSMKDLEIKSFLISGFEISEWIEDIKSKLAIDSLKEEKTALKNMKAKLESLLSDDRKKSLEIERIEKLLS